MSGYPILPEGQKPPLDWFVERCPKCGSWMDVSGRVFEHYGCVTCAMLGVAQE